MLAKVRTRQPSTMHGPWNVAPGSTATVEGIFSVAGYILSPRRMSFTDENFDNQLFANLNAGIVEVSSDELKQELI